MLTYLFDIHKKISTFSFSANFHSTCNRVKPTPKITVYNFFPFIQLNSENIFNFVAAEFLLHLGKQNIIQLAQLNKNKVWYLIKEFSFSSLYKLRGCSWPMFQSNPKILKQKNVGTQSRNPPTSKKSSHI